MAEDPKVPKYIETMYGKHPWITRYTLNEFGTKKLTPDAKLNLGSVLILYPIGICMLFLCLAVVLIGIIYACFRCAGRCNPRKYRLESKCDKGCRWVLGIVMVIIIILIFYCLIIIAFSSLAIAHSQIVDGEENRIGPESRAAAVNAQKKREIADPTEKINVDQILQAVENDVRQDYYKACTHLPNLEEMKKKTPDIEKHVEELCIEILIWSDRMRIHHRNITTLLAQFKSGRKLIRDISFENFPVEVILIGDLFEINNQIILTNRIISKLEKKYLDEAKFVNTVNGKIKEVVTPYVKKELELLSKEKVPASLPSSQKNDEFKIQLRNKADNEKAVNLKQKPLWVIIWEWISIIWVILISIILIVALVFRCCGKRYRHENGIFNQEIGSLLFQIAVFMIFAYFLLVLLPFLWNFFNHVISFNGGCKLLEHKSARSASMAAHSTTKEMFLLPTAAARKSWLRNISFKKRDADVDPERSKKIAEISSKVGSMMPPAPESNKDKLIKTTTRMLNDYLNTKIKNLPEAIKAESNPTYFKNIYEKILAFAKREMVRNPTEQHLTICNVNALRANQIEYFLNNSINIRATKITNELGTISKFMKEGLFREMKGCLDEVEKVKNYYKTDYPLVIEKFFKEKEKRDLEFKPFVEESRIIDEEMENKDKKNKTEIPKKKEPNKEKEKPKKIPKQKQSECSAHLTLLANIWTWTIVVLLLLLPLIPIAIYLSRLYTYGKRKRLRAVPGKECICIQRPPRRCEHPQRFIRTRRTLLRIKLYFKGVPEC